MKLRILIAILPLAGALALPAPVLGQSGYYSGTEEDDILPADFRGRITYAGTHEGEIATSGPPLRSLRTRDIARSITGGRTRQLGGSLNLELTFDGDRVFARYSGSGGINTGSMTGSRSGARCRLVDDRGGDVLEAACTRTSFSGESSLRQGRQTSRVRFEARATGLVDAGSKERQPDAAAPVAATPAAAAGNGPEVFHDLFEVSGREDDDLERLSNGTQQIIRLTYDASERLASSSACSLTLVKDSTSIGTEMLRQSLFGPVAGRPAGMFGRLLNPQAMPGRIVGERDLSRAGYVGRRALFIPQAAGEPAKGIEIMGFSAGGFDYFYIKTCHSLFYRDLAEAERDMAIINVAIRPRR